MDPSSRRIPPPLHPQNLEQQIKEHKKRADSAAEGPGSAEEVEDVEALTSGGVGVGENQGVLELYDQLLVEDNDALDIIKLDVRSQAKGGASTADAAQQLQLCFQSRKLMHTIQRNTCMLDSLRRSVDSVRTTRSRATTAEDIARVYAVVLQNVADLRGLLTAPEDAPQVHVLEILNRSTKALRCFYLSASHVSACQWKHARKLLTRAEEHAHQAKELLDNLPVMAVSLRPRRALPGVDRRADVRATPCSAACDFAARVGRCGRGEGAD